MQKYSSINAMSLMVTHEGKRTLYNIEQFIFSSCFEGGLAIMCMKHDTDSLHNSVSLDIALYMVKIMA